MLGSSFLSYSKYFSYLCWVASFLSYSEYFSYLCWAEVFSVILSISVIFAGQQISELF